MKHNAIKPLSIDDPITPYVTAKGGVVILNGPFPLDKAHRIARLCEAAPTLLASLKQTLRALESHLDESCRDHNISHRDLLCACNQNEVVRARAAIAKTTQSD